VIKSDRNNFLYVCFFHDLQGRGAATLTRGASGLVSTLTAFNSGSSSRIQQQQQQQTQSTHWKKVKNVIKSSFDMRFLWITGQRSSITDKRSSKTGIYTCCSSNH